MANTGELKKLRIIAYKDEKYSELAFGSESESTYTTAINPESIKFSYAIKLNTDQADGTTATETKPEKATPPSVSIQFLFDGTGLIPGSSTESVEFKNPNDESDLRTWSKGPVAQQIDNFKKFIYTYASDTHSPLYLKIIYGVILFRGVAETLDYDYKLFGRDGQPLRVIANTKFVGSIDEDLEAAIRNFSSPDLTHIRQVVEGDTLPLMCNRIYGDSKYYLEVAKANRITNFRKLTPGQRINFPPVEKISK